MGMYNEVFKKCPYCHGRGCAQISQIVLGFGYFDLDNPKELAETYSLEELKQLERAVEDEFFNCESCRKQFTLNLPDKDLPEKLRLASKLAGLE